MSPSKRIIWFALLAAACYMLFVLLWHPLSRPARAAFAAVGNTIFDKFGAHGRVVFEPMEEPTPVLDTRWRLLNLRDDVRKTIATSVRYQVYLPLVVFISLVVATPLPWSRRGRALLLGVPLLCLFIVLRFWLMNLHVFGEQPAPLYHRGEFWQRTLSFLVHMTYHSPLSSVVAPAVVWIVATFRRGDWQQLQGRPAVPADAPGPPAPRKSQAPARGKR